MYRQHVWQLGASGSFSVVDCQQFVHYDAKQSFVHSETFREWFSVLYLENYEKTCNSWK